MEILIIISVIIIQITVFVIVLRQIHQMSTFFPKSAKDFGAVKPITIPQNAIYDNHHFEFIMENINSPENLTITEEEIAVDIDVVQYDLDTISKPFKSVLDSINSYLIRNKEAAADFGILKDITQRHIRALDNSIGNLISVPLYLGLIGTFIGIIVGLGSIDFVESSASDSTSIETISTDSIQSLIRGVMTAMVASLTGLLLTVLNTAIFYKLAISKNESGENIFYDFIQRDLLNRLGHGFADTVNALGNNLKDFNTRFGYNLESYETSFQLLNDNLGKQKDYLDSVKQIGLEQMSTQIVEVFSKVEDASSSFQEFRKYQDSLNENIRLSKEMLDKYIGITELFQNFNHNLNEVSEGVADSQKFYQTFKQFLEEKYETIKSRTNEFTHSLETIDAALTKMLGDTNNIISEQKDLYNAELRKTFDYINKDIALVFTDFRDMIEVEATSIKAYLAEEERGLNDILKKNKEFFTDFRYIKQIADYQQITNKILQENQKANQEQTKQLNLLLKEVGSSIKTMNLSIQTLHKSVHALSNNVKDFNNLNKEK